MIVDISDIISCTDKQAAKDVEIDFSSFASGMGVFPVLEKTPFTLSIANVENKRLDIRGRTELKIVVPCDRCLEDVPITFDLDIAKEINLVKYLQQDEEELQETDYMLGTSLDVDKLIFGEILVSWPMRVLCREDCAGICKQCGANLNLAVCQCQKTEPDPRMAAIQDIFNQFKEV